MSAAIHICKFCGNPLKGKPYVFLGNRPGTSVSRGSVCAICVTEFQKTTGIPTHLDKLVTWICDVRLKPESKESLQQRIKRLEEVLAKHGIEVS